MRFLLLHPEDSPLAGPWVGQRWDAIFDLGRGGWAACERWSRFFGCPVKPIDGIRDGFAEVARVRELLQLGLGRLVDREGLDWWELSAIMVHHDLESLVVLRKFANEVARDAEVWITRGGVDADALRLSLGARLHVIPSSQGSSRKGLKHYLSRLRSLPLHQVVQVLGDKYDTGYRIRRHFHRQRRRSRQPVVLAPSSYINMSLAAASYAGLLPETKFLLVSTRQSGKLIDPPPNVDQAWLASYARSASVDEHRELLERWTGLKKEIEAVPELAALAQLGLVDDFPRRFAHGLAIRNAWLRVLETEPVQSVLCCDDSNPHTHIPLQLAQKRGLATIVSHHGALDGRYMIKTNHADVILAKGRMEQDYLVRTCGVAASEVEIGAPSSLQYLGSQRVRDGDWIVFFSEPYEMSTGRTEEIYRDVIPGLIDLARRTGKLMVLKLHPSENLRDRQSLAHKVLSPEQLSAVKWVTGPLRSELLSRTWFGVAVLSSVAMDCVVLGIPCFLCDWLNLWPYGYMEQYEKFGVGIGLRSPEEIARIPEVLATFRPDSRVVADCWKAITPERFGELLARRKTEAATTVPVFGAQ